MRSCEVFGVQELNVVEQKYAKQIDSQIAMGAQKWVDINRFENINSCIDTLQGKGFQIVATTPHVNDCLLDDFDISKPSAFFFGTENNGLSNDVLKRADGFLKIPMVGFTESLNISVSVAIILQQLTTKLRNSDINWQLSENEILERRLSWTRNSIKDIKRIEARYYDSHLTPSL